jgi:predicted metallo-beta-lactamase superfamily hydrolase
VRADLERLHQLLQSVLREVEQGIRAETYPEWSGVKENLLQALELVRKLERDQLWDALGKPS